MSNLVSTQQYPAIGQFAVGSMEWRAIEMKYSGRKHREIAAALGRSETTVDEWFSPAKNGRLVEAYREYEEKMAEYTVIEAENLLRKNAKNAAITMLNLLHSSDDKVKHAAAKEILNRTAGMPVQRSENENHNYSFVVVRGEDATPDTNAIVIEPTDGED